MSNGFDTASHCPLVSVIIPMFNSAKFIPQTLESLLYQTMPDFEVIVVDDCSTDNGVEVVMSFSKRFGGRLRVLILTENTGMPGVPRNLGIQTARGKYIAFLDSDDLFTTTALEELTTLAEKYQADVVRLHKNFCLQEGKVTSIYLPAMTDMTELTNPENFTVASYDEENLDEPTLELNDTGARVRKWINSEANAFWATWLMFYRRNFLVDNDIFFPPMLTCEDAPFAFKALCLAKNYLNVPNIVCIIRPRQGSVSRDTAEISFEENVHKRTRALIDGCKEFESIMDEIDFFQKNPDVRYSVLAWFANYRISITAKFYRKHTALELNELVKKEFNTFDAELMAYLFNTVNVQQNQIKELQAANENLSAQINS